MKEDLSEKQKLDYSDSHKDIDQAKNYEYNLYADETYDSCMWEIEKKFLVKEIKSIKKGNIKYLDFACGTGRVISFVEPFTTESTGIDVSWNMLDIARNKTKKTKFINCNLIEEDVIKDEKYNLITAFRFFLNAEDDLRKKIMPLISGKLSDDGILIFNIHGNTSSYHIWPVILGHIGMKKVKLNHLSYFNTLELIKNSDLKLMKLYGVGFIPSSFYRWFGPLRSVLMSLDNCFSHLPFMKYFARYLIYICARK